MNDWRDRAACRDVDTEVFYAPDGERGTYRRTARECIALAICGTCTVKDECREHALAFEVWGVWGATTEDERRRLRRRVSA